MRLINADAIKQKYRDKFIKSLVDKTRGIDLSEYAEEPSKSFNRFIDEIPTVDVLDKIDKIRNEIKQTADEEQKHDEKWAIGLRYAVKIIDKYKAESEG